MYAKSSEGLILLALATLTVQQSILDGVIKLVQDGDTQFSMEPRDVPDDKMKKEYDFIIVGAGTAGCVLANRLSENPAWSVLVIEAGRSENFLMDMPILANYLQFTETNWRSYKDVLPYFKKVENFSVPEYQDPRYHSNDGYLSVSYAPYKTKIADAILEASQQNGLNLVDYNGPTQTGVSRLQVSMRDGVRESASRGYLHPISRRPNLHMKKYSMVQKILIDPKTKKSLWSGVRTSGTNLQDLSQKGGDCIRWSYQLASTSHAKRNWPQETPDIPRDTSAQQLESRLITNENLKLYLNHHKGPMSVPGGCEVLVFHDFSNPNDVDGYPEIELLFQGGSIVSDPILRKDFGITDKIYDRVYKPIQDAETFMVFPMLLRPKSKGRIMLKDNSYKTKPMIYPNYFAHQQDMDTILKGVRLVLNITSQPALQALGTKLHDIPIPQCSDKAFGSDDYFNCMTRYFTFTIYHHSGTCKMGAPTDKTAVVDPRLRVYGVKNLRVIDASIIPEIPAAHTNSPTFMIAEKGADMIKEDWGYRN
ncbi:hypothetical protein NQ314_015741 [Rhamnusium bicolor]|uniref:Uncharacterized protein n=1 Tax=Rhamnusium bicolor TaxID=1586634 RepID=A0AAV8WXV3_9CUCU|nr:hypothetical protein NQ314_015741 [Rhamnusium bicolor]